MHSSRRSFDPSVAEFNSMRGQEDGLPLEDDLWPDSQPDPNEQDEDDQGEDEPTGK